MDAGKMIVDNFTPAERRACSSFFSGPESTRVQRDALRVALQHCASRPLADAVRAHFNHMREEDEPIPACLVTSATRLVQAS